MFRCNLPSALLAEWPGSFTCHWGNMGVEQMLNKEAAHKVNSGEENSPTTPAKIWTCNLSIISLTLYGTSVVPSHPKTIHLVHHLEERFALPSTLYLCYFLPTPLPPPQSWKIICPAYWAGEGDLHVHVFVCGESACTVSLGRYVDILSKVSDLTTLQTCFCSCPHHCGLSSQWGFRLSFHRNF